jgi:hypothetical protein
MRAAWLVGALALATATLALAGGFAKRPTLSVGVKPPRAGTVTSSPKGIKCAPRCKLATRKGSVVRLSAHPARGYGFRRWGLACSGTKPTCSVKMTASKHATASFRKTPLPPPPPPPPPPAPPPGFAPDLIKGTWTGSWTDSTFNTTGSATFVVTTPGANTFHFTATFGGSVFACGAQPTVSADVVQGPGGPNQWNANGFEIALTTQNGGTVFLNHDFAMHSLDGHGVPGCRPAVSWALTGGFNSAYTSFNGAITTTLEPGSNPSTANALISLTKGPSKGGRG